MLTKGGETVKFKDYYEVLGVEKNADDKAIRRAYRKLAKQYHPDHNPDDKASEERFKEISEAYEVLSDKDKRQKYDQFGSNFNAAGAQDFDPRQYGFNNASFHGNAGGYSDFFNMFFGDEFFDAFGGGTGRRYNRSPKGQDIEASLTISIDEAYNGGKRTFTLNGHDSSITVTIPAGITSGERMRLKGKGYPGTGGMNGDLILMIEVQDTRDMKLDGLNITSELKLYPWEAYFGCERAVRTLAGNKTLRVPAGIQTGRKIRLKDMGFKNRKGLSGHHYIEMVIVNPTHLSEEQEAHYRALMDMTTH